jgi:hypothetical protein
LRNTKKKKKRRRRISSRGDAAPFESTARTHTVDGCNAADADRQQVAATNGSVHVPAKATVPPIPSGTWSRTPIAPVRLTKACLSKPIQARAFLLQSVAGFGQ